MANGAMPLPTADDGIPLADDVRSVFDGRLAFGRRPALLLLDVVQAYVRPGSLLYATAFVAAVVPSERLVAAARAAGVPVIFTRVVYGARGAGGGIFYRKVPALRYFDEGSELGAFLPTLWPSPSDAVVTKQYASAFFGTSLA